ncbi:MAG: hypothetical protein ACPG7W_01030 [Paracoccaceae bacterium]
MNQLQFIMATSAVLFVAFCLGWFAHWLGHRFTRVSAEDIGQLEKISQELHEAEDQRDQAIEYYQQRESELTTRVAQAEHDLSVAMDGLRNAREEAEELRAYIERESSF